MLRLQLFEKSDMILKQAECTSTSRTAILTAFIVMLADQRLDLTHSIKSTR